MPKNNKLIFVPFAIEDNKNSGLNIQWENRFDLYYKNICVALVSLKKYNSECDVALVTNVEVPKYYKEILNKNDIKIFTEKYDEYVFPKDYNWSLAFYKLCALKKVINYNYEYYCYLDADIIAQQSFDNIWKECKDNVLLYDINHGLGVKDYQIFIEEVKKFGVDKYITHFGGEFYAANKENSKKFINECDKIFKQMQKTKFVTTKGDEFIVSLAAEKIKNDVKNAGAYIYRYWTGTFYLVSTNYKYNSVTILHLPAEKSGGVIKIFNKYILKEKFPSQEKVWKICHINRKNYGLIIKESLKKYFHK